jgi:hypothetical protein
MIIYGLWIGSQLTQFEHNSIKSWLNNGFTYHLYTYFTVENIPDGVIVKDARDILPETEIFYYHNALTPFSDYFRFKLLYELGGIWSDCDIYCINKFDILDDYLFICERTIKQGAFKSIKPIKPINSFIYVKHSKDKFILDMLNNCIKYKNEYLEKAKPMQCKNEGLNAMHWKAGIKLFNKIIIKHNLEQYVQSYKFAFPIDWWLFSNVFKKNVDKCSINRGWEGELDLTNNFFLDTDIKMITIHNGWIKNKNIDKQQIFNNCFIAKLFEKINI